MIRTARPLFVLQITDLHLLPDAGSRLLGVDTALSKRTPDALIVTGDIAHNSTPSTCFQFVAGRERFTLDTTPPGWRWLELVPDGTLRSEIGRATDFVVPLDLSTFEKH